MPSLGDKSLPLLDSSIFFCIWQALCFYSEIMKTVLQNLIEQTARVASPPAPSAVLVTVALPRQGGKMLCWGCSRSAEIGF